MLGKEIEEEGRRRYRGKPRELPFGGSERLKPQGCKLIIVRDAKLS